MSYCDWDTTDELCLRYHDEEWGVLVHDDRTQFEYLSLEVMQCGPWPATPRSSTTSMPTAGFR